MRYAMTIVGEREIPATNQNRTKFNNKNDYFNHFNHVNYLDNGLKFWNYLKLTHL
jgi:hypothetical protein